MTALPLLLAAALAQSPADAPADAPIAATAPTAAPAGPATPIVPTAAPAAVPAGAPATATASAPSAPLAATPNPPAAASTARVTPEGAIVVTASPGAKIDPARRVNAASFVATQKADSVVVRPLAMGYKHVVPSPLRSALHNFFANLSEPVVAVNFLLQHKVGKAAETVGRFGINSTLGVAGLFDMARKKPFNLPWRRNGFALTLGYYGVGPGPYLFIPLVGPTTIRDWIGLGVDRLALPISIGGPLRSPYYIYGGFVVRSLDDRLAIDAKLTAMSKTEDFYKARRDAYIRARQADIDALKGKIPAIAPRP